MREGKSPQKKVPSQHSVGRVRAESLHGLLLTRNAPSGKRESRRWGERKPQWTFADSPGRLNISLQASFIPPHVVILLLGAPGKQKQSTKLKLGGLWKEKSHCPMLLPPTSASLSARHSSNVCWWVGRNLQGWFWQKAENPWRPDLRQMHRAKSRREQQTNSSLKQSKISNCHKGNYLQLPNL